jgi:hypothetical protein
LLMKLGSMDILSLLVGWPDSNANIELLGNKFRL